MPILASIFTDGMVLQCDRPLPVWGHAVPGSVVRVGLAGAVAEAAAATDGSFRAVLPPQPAGGPHALTVSDGGGALRLEDVLLGDVWLCVGQSNMLWPASACTGADEVLARADRAGLRLCRLPVPGSPEHGDPWRWRRAEAQAASAFSAVALICGSHLHERLGRPVGLIQAAWGGTHIEAWMARHDLLADPATRRDLERYEALVRDGIPVPDWPVSAKAGGWADPACDDRSWPVMALPGCWQDRGLHHHGVVWFRRRIAIPAAWAGQDLVLGLGSVAQSATVHAGGTVVTPGDGGTFRIPPAAVGGGTLALAVRVVSWRDGSGLCGPAAAMRLAPAGGGDGIALAGAWRWQVERREPLIDISLTGCVGHPQDAPHRLFDALIAPLCGLGLRGLLWYQGEQNAWAAGAYAPRFRQLIRDWRRRWDRDDLPVAFVQIPNVRDRTQVPGDSVWAELREAQAAALAEPATAMAVTIDLGEADIHPRDKREVGRRLAEAALSLVGDGRPAATGPRITGCRFADGVATATVEAHAPLATRDGQAVRGLAVAGADRRFHWASATIDGCVITAWSPLVPAPVALRHAWADNPDANLADAAGLPLAPWRSDAWPGLA